MKNRKTIFTMILFALGSFALSPRLQAVVPPPDGGYPGGNTAEGGSALLSLTTGTFNTAVGLFSLLSNTEGQFNTAIGAGALLANVGGSSTFEGVENTATGAGALLSNTIGAQNTANGAFALFSNTEGSSNTANGDRALFSNTIGNTNTATGSFTLINNTEGSDNTATGSFALSDNTTGQRNTATGAGALETNTTGGSNTATGVFTLRNNTEGHDNTATGLQALKSNTTGEFNTAVGRDALGSNTTGSGNVALGVAAGSNLTTGNDNIEIGNEGVDGDSGTIRIGTASDHTRTFIAGVNSAVVSGGAVFVNGAGQLGIQISSARFKDEIQPMGAASEALFALKPVTFRYKSEIDPDRTPQFGLLAEEVEKINPDLIIRDRDGRPHTVRYEQINAMLLNEFLKEHRKVEEQQATIGRLKADAVKQEATTSELKKNTEVLTAELKKQATQIQEVSTEIEMRRSVTRMVLNPRAPHANEEGGNSTEKTNTTKRYK
jgi:hypothetical protein